jgi:hypothetical protein
LIVTVLAGLPFSLADHALKAQAANKSSSLLVDGIFGGM